MKFKERKRRHDDAHRPLGGKGNRAKMPKSNAAPTPSKNYIERRKIIGWDRNIDLPIYQEIEHDDV